MAESAASGILARIRRPPMAAENRERPLSNSLLGSVGEPRQPRYQGKPFIRHRPSPPSKLVYDDCPGCGIRITVCHLEAWVTTKAKTGNLVRRINAVHPSQACRKRAAAKYAPFTVEVLPIQDVEKRLKRQRPAGRIGQA